MKIQTKTELPKRKDIKAFRRTVLARRFNTLDFWQSYNSIIYRKTKIHALPNKSKLEKVLKALFKNASDAMVEREGGVVLEGIGYFAIWMPLIRRFEDLQVQNNTLTPNFKTDYYNYIPMLFTDVFNTDFLKGWSMDFSFNGRISRKIISEVREGRKFILAYSEVKKVYNLNYLQNTTK